MRRATEVELLLLGTGCSTGIPDVICLTRAEPCQTCLDAQQPDSPNKRLTTSLMIRVNDPEAGTVRNILIDSTKFLPEMAARWFPRYGVERIDSLVLTHSHFDAVGGLDALRSWTNVLGYTMPVYLRQSDLDVLGKLFFYIVEPKANFAGSGIAQLEFVTIGDEPFSVNGMEFVPLAVQHGENYVANGYRFGDVCYISDVSAVPDATRAKMAGCRLLVLDAQQKLRTFGNHFTLEAALQLVSELQPERTLLIGMSHRLEHNAANAELSEWSKQTRLDVQLARDGMSVKHAIAL